MSDEKERNYSLDLLRIIAMLFIVCLHYLGVGGSFYNLNSGEAISLNYYLASQLEALATVGVNCFVLISGYFCVSGTFRLKKVGKLYANTIFYTLIAFIVYTAIFGFALSNLIDSFFPLIMSTYWFITVYIVLYILSPYINKLCEALSQKQHLTLLIILFVVFSVWKSLIPIAETIDTRKGYSLTWFIVLYLTGAYIRKYNVMLFKRNWLNLVMYFAISLLIAGIKLSAILLSEKISFLNQGQNLFYHYDSVTILASSVFLFVFFKRLTVKAKVITQTVRFITPSVFSVYLIHENFLWREFLWNDVLKANEFVNSAYYILHFAGCVLAVFIGCILLDQLRKIIFRFIVLMSGKVRNKDNLNGKPE